MQHFNDIKAKVSEIKMPNVTMDSVKESINNLVDDAVNTAKTTQEHYSKDSIKAAAQSVKDDPKSLVRSAPAGIVETTTTIVGGAAVIGGAVVAATGICAGILGLEIWKGGQRLAAKITKK